MPRRFIFVAIAAALAAVWPSGGYAATAPANAPTLTTPQYAFPFTIHWTPGNDILNTSQSVYRSTGACATPAAAGGLIITFPGNATTDYTGRPVDGTYCYTIRAADALGGTADSPGVTVSVDTMNPTATVTVANQVAGVVSGVVGVSGTSSDAVSGVGSSVLHAGAVGACPNGPVVGPTWDTTTVANGAYDVCNVVTDNVGHVAIAKTTVTVSNALPPAPPAAATTPAAGGVASAPPATLSGKIIDKVAPLKPTKLSIVLPRSKLPPSKIRVTLRWKKPIAPDLARVVVVVNLKRAPRGPADGSKVYSGLGSSVVLGLRAGETGYAALYAYDRNGNVSGPARRFISLASLIPLRPLTGSILKADPVLTWKPAKGSAYYNVQIFRNGTRMLVGWPTTASFRVPAGKLTPGNYVWYVWPAVKESGSAPTFGSLIGRATFVLETPSGA